ncbi:MAG TPA: hypothetical protein VHV47_09660, partial [Opitutaceae bacterium]|nr:hypothetical protein [Opitutaceae bacterium]
WSGPALILAAGCALAAAGRADPATASPQSLFYRFSLAPRSMQADPLLDITVMTDVTEAGKKLPKVTKDYPAYYLVHSEGFKEMGEGIPSGTTLAQEDMDRLLRRSLADGGYREAGPAAEPPSLLVLYSWGLYSKREHRGMGSTPLDTNEMFDRAELVGGDAFAAQILKMMQWKADLGPVSGRHAATSNLSNPLDLYQLEGRTHGVIVDMADSDLYYVVASAYDYAAYRQHQRRLLWRTRIAILANGVSQPQVLPTMVLGASPYFGKQTHGEPTILTRHAIGRVEVGPVRVVSFGTEAEAPVSPADPAPPAWPALPGR